MTDHAITYLTDQRGSGGTVACNCGWRARARSAEDAAERYAQHVKDAQS